MKHLALRFLGLLLVSALAGCAVEVPLSASFQPLAPARVAEPLSDMARQRQLLAPEGVLRVGVYAGSPTSLVRNPGALQPVGVAYELGHAMAQRLQVPVQLREYPRVAEVIRALAAGEIDVTFTNASAERARRVDFTPALLRLELGVLVPPGSTIPSFAELDRAGLRVGVSQGSSSQAALSTRLQHARLVPVDSLAVARQMLAQRELDAFITNKGILFELADQLPRFVVLPDRWGVEQLALAIPQGRGLAMPWLQQFANDMVRTGEVQAMARRAGLRGLTAGPEGER